MPQVARAGAIVSGSSTLMVSVPADAKVLVNGRTTSSTGEVRKYTFAGPKQDAPFRCQVRVEFVHDGTPVSYEKTISIAAGQTGTLSFGAPQPKTASKATSVRPEEFAISD